MNDPKETGGTAFPCLPPLWPDGAAAAGYPHPCEGMTLRDYFAAKAMPDWPLSGLHDIDAAYDRCATHAYRMADAMLKARAS